MKVAQVSNTGKVNHFYVHKKPYSGSSIGNSSVNGSNLGKPFTCSVLVLVVVLSGVTFARF